MTEPRGRRLWAGRPVAALAAPVLWVDDAGEPVVVAEGAVLYALGSSTASPDAADAPAGSVPLRPRDAAELSALVPAGAGLLVDRATARAQTARPQDVDAVRPGPVPRGGEPDLVISAPPGHLTPMVAEARVVARQAGARDVRAAWAAFPGGRAVLVVMVRLGRGEAGESGSEAVLDAVYEAVVRHAPCEGVRVVAETDLPTSRVPQITASGRARAAADPRLPGVPNQGYGEIRGRTHGNGGLAVTG